MRHTKEFLPETARGELVPENYFVPLDLERVFGRAAPLEIDVGCGNGKFLAAAAAANPEHNFLGLERLLGRVCSGCRKIARQNLANARILRIESFYAVRYLIPPESAAAIHLLFPDPWQKRRHQRRRIANEEFLHSVHRALRTNGYFHIATDDENYFLEINEAIARVGGWTPDETPHSFPSTTFEEQFRAEGREIQRLVLRKVSEEK